MDTSGILKRHGSTILVCGAIFAGIVALFFIMTLDRPPSPVIAKTDDMKSPPDIVAAQIPGLSFPVKEWGAYAGWKESDLRELEAGVGKPAQYRAVFVHWGNNNAFPFYLTDELKKSGKTLIIFWEAFDNRVASMDQPDFSYAAILSGRWDGYLTKFAEDAAAYGSPVIMVPFSEMNGNWTPWSGTLYGNTPEQHNAAYQYLHTFFADAPNVKFGWAPNKESVPDTVENAMEQYFPGDAFVDYVGVDGFNTGDPPKTFDQVFGKALGRLKVYGKPMFIFSFASAEGILKADWITDALTVQMQRYPALKAWIWFNEKKKHDWRIDSDSASLQAFKAALP